MARILSRLLVVIAVLFSSLVPAAPGDFDSGFGAGGLVMLGANDFLAPFAIATDAQGRILVLGSSGDRIAIGRLTASGQIDPSFGVNGRMVMADRYHAYQSPRRYVIKRDARGRIVLAAPAMVPSTGPAMPDSYAAVYRLTANGALDSTFGDAGVLNFKGNQTGFVMLDMAVDNQDRILLAGAGYSSNSNDPVGADVVRLLESGKPDSSFGEQGYVYLGRQSFPQARKPFAIALDAQQRIVLGFEFHHPLRLLPDGGMDQAFSTAAAAAQASLQDLVRPNAILVQPDGGIVFARETWGGPSQPASLFAARLRSDGSADLGFGVNGRLLSPALGVSSVSSALLDASGRLIQLGSTYGRSLFSGDAFVTRYTTSGTPDTAFATSGVRQMDFLDSDNAYAAGIDSAGRILLVGSMYEADQNSVSFIVRLLSDPGAQTSDSTPDPFVIKTRQVQVSTRVAFAGVPIRGINTPTSVSVQGGEYCVSSSSACTCDVLSARTTVGTVQAGQFVCPFHQASSTGGTRVDSQLNVGGFVATFSSLTAGVAVLPAPWYDIGSDTWWNTSESGWGVVFSQRGNLLLGGMYVYGDDRQPAWYAFFCTVSADRCEAELIRTSGPPMEQAFDATRVARTSVGKMLLVFSSRDSVGLNIELDGNKIFKTASRQKQLSFPAVGTDYTDMWWSPAESGWGLSVVHRNTTMFTVWYGYDAQGRQLWLTMLCVWYGDNCTGSLEQSTGPGMRQSFDPSQVVRRTVGEMRIQPSGNLLILDFTLNGKRYVKNVQRF